MTWHYGCDIGARRLAIACAETHHVAEIVLPPLRRGTQEDTSTVLHQLGWWIQQVVPPEATLWVEKPVMLRGKRANPQTVIRMSLTMGTVILAHPGRSYPIESSQWKLATVGDGSADKPAVRAWLEGAHPALAAACGPSQDLADASCISIAGAALASER